jgi:(heptosyl)LPS beta-1,4-glucosyltransferase
MDEKRITLGVVAISRNEERDIVGFLGHLLPWVDEIIIVDDDSTDETRKIIKSAGEKVMLIEHQLSESGGFSEQRNIGIEASRADWILNMDIDERVTPVLAKEMLAAISTPDLNGFRYKRLNFFVHRPMKAGEWSSWNHPQLARRGFHQFADRLHERCIIKGEPESIGQLNALMWHLNDESYRERIGKSSKYSLVEAEYLLGTGKKISSMDIFIKPIIKFIKEYLFKRGMIDGVPGLIAALHSADAVFRSYALAWDEQNHIPREQLENKVRLMWDQGNLQHVLDQKAVFLHGE